MKDLIKAIRSNLKMSQEQLAFQMGVPPVTVNRWENGKANPSFMAQKQLYNICVDHHLDLSDYIVEENYLMIAGKYFIMHQGLEFQVKFNQSVVRDAISAKAFIWEQTRFSLSLLSVMKRIQYFIHWILIWRI